MLTKTCLINYSLAIQLKIVHITVNIDVVLQ